MKNFPKTIIHIGEQQALHEVAPQNIARRLLGSTAGREWQFVEAEGLIGREQRLATRRKFWPGEVFHPEL